MKLPRPRARRKGRIEIIPMIDVMFFLLVTFMLASLSLQRLHSLPVDLPRGAAQPLAAKSSITLTVTREANILLNEAPVALDDIPAALKAILAGPDQSVIVNADNAAPHGIVVQAMLKAREAGAAHFLFALKRP